MTAAYDWRWSRIAEILNRLPMVGWDRLVSTVIPAEGGEHRYVVVYGWIERADGGRDFVTLDFATWAEVPGFVTSSRRYSREMHATIYGDASSHTDCVSITETPLKGLVKRRVKWRP